jgi:hypothetical protein
MLRPQKCGVIVFGMLLVLDFGTEDYTLIKGQSSPSARSLSDRSLRAHVPLTDWGAAKGVTGWPKREHLTGRSVPHVSNVMI